MENPLFITSRGDIHHCDTKPGRESYPYFYICHLWFVMGQKNGVMRARLLADLNWDFDLCKRILTNVPAK